MFSHTIPRVERVEETQQVTLTRCPERTARRTDTCGISQRNSLNPILSAPLSPRFITTSKDLETGEIETHIVPQTPDLFDQETGELNAIAFRKTKFNIPKAYLRQYEEEEPSRCSDVYTLSNKERVMHLKEEIILGYNKTSHRMFLIPSLFLFFRLTAIFIITVETLLHIWAHRRNSRNTNPCIYYRSPLHVVSSQFCAICRSESSMKRVKKIQDERTRIRRLHQFDFVTRTLT
ncbi:uncharacterized protein LOC132261064 [Phlebotomus argentipes]|uniref:uncharacterized protein LOC132261064 n=1 Tax=Phlebotomus argentipes TaxID=94469 RepID=UPI0028930516|nr:uncharacterized protein LOC132261064 [Phlebotomus argentipes]